MSCRVNNCTQKVCFNQYFFKTFPSNEIFDENTSNYNFDDGLV